MIIRPEDIYDVDDIRSLITSAFDGTPHSDGTEGAIVDALREGGALTVSLVAEQAGDIVGHVAFSPVRVENAVGDWYGLGPLAVRLDRRRHGIGVQLVENGLSTIRSLGAAGCVVLGDPSYYSRFGFKADPNLRFPGVPSEYFQCLDFGTGTRFGVVAYHKAFHGV